MESTDSMRRPERDKMDFKAIDMHTHVFNLHYFPVQGILDDSGLIDLPCWLARALAKAALAITEDDPLLDDGQPRAAAMPVSMSAEAVEDAIVNFDRYVGRAAQRIPSWLLKDPDILEALRRSGAERGKAFSVRDADMEDKGFVLRCLIDLARKYLVGPVRAIEWLIAVVTQRERDIAALLRKSYPDVEYFVHHMMALDSFYPGPPPTYAFAPRQIARMRNLDRLFGDKLITFVAWDPFVDDGLDIVKDAIEKKGCRGIKVYPPSGYRPIGNVDDGFVPHPDGPSAAVLDRRNQALFAYCVESDTPVFTHCTRKGFEARDGYGANSDPDYWRRVLESDGMRDLRLCLGHAGGTEWFADDAAFADSFPKGVYDLCTDPRFPNVYCEVGILDEVNSDVGFALFQNRLVKLIGGRTQFADRIMYGSDWHFLYMNSEHLDFFRNYERLFQDAKLAPHAVNFFRDNSVRYLNDPGIRVA
jgi:predicted TIM-barrel fold metal-dependent hydrolase